jgi:acyl-CoA dehydrogenase
VDHGTDAQKRRFLPEIATGRKMTAFALSEPEAGSDASNLRTTAELEAGHYRLNGLKHFVTNGPFADYVTVLALTNPPLRDKGISMFVVERGTPGFRMNRVQKTMGPEAYVQAEMVFDDCRIPVDNRIGAAGEGLRIALSGLTEGRVALAMACVGAGQRLLDESLSHAKSRIQFNKPIAHQQAVQFMLSDMETELFAARATTLEAARRVMCGQHARRHASAAKLFASEAVGRIADRAVQILGAMGYSRDLPVERIYREVRLYRLLEGTSEIQRLIIARDLLAD